MDHINPIEYFVTPVSPYFICDHFISTEIYREKATPKWKYIGIELVLRANDLLKNKNYNDIKNFDIVQVQIDFFDFFYDEILPIICKNNIKVIIITSQENLPQIKRTKKTDDLLQNDNILLWISQNPIYTNNAKYMAFPYGILHRNITEYADFVKSNNITGDKNTKILNQNATVHPHLPKDHIRRVFDIFGKNSGEKMIYTKFLSNILDAEFIISTAGDREDSYRHYECIGLNAIPVSNISEGYKEIFGDNMIFSNAKEMIDMIDTNIVNYDYKKPDRDIITIPYWVRKINQRINLLDPQALKDRLLRTSY